MRRIEYLINVLYLFDLRIQQEGEEEKRFNTEYDASTLPAQSYQLNLDHFGGKERHFVENWLLPNQQLFEHELHCLATDKPIHPQFKIFYQQAREVVEFVKNQLLEGYFKDWPVESILTKRPAKNASVDRGSACFYQTTKGDWYYQYYAYKGKTPLRIQVSNSVILTELNASKPIDQSNEDFKKFHAEFMLIGDNNNRLLFNQLTNFVTVQQIFQYWIKFHKQSQAVFL